MPGYTSRRSATAAESSGIDYVAGRVGAHRVDAKPIGVLALVAHQAAHLVHADAATIYAFNPDEKTLEQVAEYDLRNPHHSIYEGKVGPRSTLEWSQAPSRRRFCGNTGIAPTGHGC